MARVTYHVVQSFTAAPDGGWVVDEPREMQSAESARSTAAALARTKKGVVAFSRTGDPATGDFDDAVELARFGELPEEF
jgi:hypothetical protein